MSVLHTILFPTDFSERSEAVFPFACSLARDQGARLLVLYVDPPPAFHGEVVDRREEDEYYEPLWAQLRRYQAPGPNVRVEHHMEEGHPTEEILRVAREEKCDLIILATHGRTGLRRLLMGSVAEEVVRRASCPVLTVSAPPPADETLPEPAPAVT
jgi:nucleotide-binding universal stress UspA family protein